MRDRSRRECGRAACLLPPGLGAFRDRVAMRAGTGLRVGLDARELECPVTEFWRRLGSSETRLHLPDDLLGGPTLRPPSGVSPVDRSNRWLDAFATWDV